MSKPKKTPAHIQARENAVTLLRAALRWVKAGIVRKGRTNIEDMLLDALYDARRHAASLEHMRTPAAMQRVLTAVCRSLPRGSDPGSADARIRYIARWSSRLYVTQDHMIKVLENATTYAVDDLAREKQKHLGRLDP